MNSSTPKSGKFLVVGSTNTDMVVKTDHLPRPGETVLGGTFLMNPGGKGASQAVARRIVASVEELKQALLPKNRLHNQ